MSIQKEILEQLYLIDKKSQTDIGKELNYHPSQISRLLKKYNFEIRNRSESIKLKHFNKNNLDIINKEILIKLYKDDIHSIIDIVKMYNVSSGFIYTKLKEYNIEIKNSKIINKEKFINKHKNSKKINKEIIEELYLNKMYSLYDIGKMFNVDHKWLSRRCVEFNIKIRSKKRSICYKTL